jgi:hypothetical protein
MNYLLSGKLQAHLGPDLLHPLGWVVVRFYHATHSSPNQSDSRSEPPILNAAAIRAKRADFIGFARTSEAGEFSVDLSAASVAGPGAKRPYTGGPLEIDVFWHMPPGLADWGRARDVQFTIATLEPDWTDEGGKARGAVDLVIPHRDYAALRTALDDWAISGRVLNRSTRAPVPGVRVLAFDTDLILDDTLGAGVTDEQGRFRIEFPAAAFRDAPLAELELEGAGPDLYFRVEADDGRLLIAEPRRRGNDPDRRNAPNLFSTEILVDE